MHRSSLAQVAPLNKLQGALKYGARTPSSTLLSRDPFSKSLNKGTSTLSNAKSMSATVVVSAYSMVICWLTLALTANAAEKLPVLKVGSETYSNVTVTEITSTEIYFNFDKGFGNAKLKNLDPVLQKHFHYDPAKTDVVERERKSADAQYRLQVANATNRSLGSKTAGLESGAAAIKSEMENAIARVREIVNEPVNPLNQTPDMQVVTYRPGWFHEGAQKPDFNTVDIRTTQQLSYDQHEYVTSDLNQGVVFRGRDLEFNPMTKYFYTDRTLPKKKLSEDEMLEVNRLYRIIGHDEALLSKLHEQ